MYTVRGFNYTKSEPSKVKRYSVVVITVLTGGSNCDLLETPNANVVMRYHVYNRGEYDIIEHLITLKQFIVKNPDYIKSTHAHIALLRCV